MDTPEATPTTTRHDGWTAQRRVRFLDCLAARGNVRLACSQVGLSTEAAYRLRRREPLFARAWAAALVLAHDDGLQVLADRAIDGIEEKVWHRGELIDTRRRYDSRLLLAHLARLDKAAENQAAQADAGRFDELLACVAGEPVPEILVCHDDALPVDREEAAERGVQQAVDEVLAEAPDKHAGHDAAAAFEELCDDACSFGRSQGEAQWDRWRADACDTVDAFCAPAGPALAGLPGSPLAEALAAAAEGAGGAAPQAAPAPLRSFPRTVSTSSTSALARSLARVEARLDMPSPRPPRKSRRGRRRK